MDFSIVLFSVMRFATSDLIPQALHFDEIDDLLFVFGEQSCQVIRFFDPSRSETRLDGDAVQITICQIQFPALIGRSKGTCAKEHGF